MLLSVCCAVRVLPAVCAWNRSCWARGFVAPESIAHDPRPEAASGAELGDLLEEVVVRVEEKRQALSERVDVKPGVDRRLHVSDSHARR